MLLVFLRNPAAFARALWSGLSGDDIIERCVSLDEVVRAIEIGLIVQHQVRGPGMAARIKRRYANVHNMARIELCRASIGAATSGSVGLNWWRKLFGPVTPAGAGIIRSHPRIFRSRCSF